MCGTSLFFLWGSIGKMNLTSVSLLKDNSTQECDLYLYYCWLVLMLLLNSLRRETGFIRSLHICFQPSGKWSLVHCFLTLSSSKLLFSPAFSSMLFLALLFLVYFLHYSSVVLFVYQLFWYFTNILGFSMICFLFFSSYPLSSALVIFSFVHVTDNCFLLIHMDFVTFLYLHVLLSSSHFIFCTSILFFMSQVFVFPQSCYFFPLFTLLFLVSSSVVFLVFVFSSLLSSSLVPP